MVTNFSVTKSFTEINDSIKENFLMNGHSIFG